MAKLVDAFADQPPVDLQLLLAGTAGADGADRPRRGTTAGAGDRIQVRPHPRQAGVGVFQLGQLNLEFGLLGLGPRGEDIEDQLAAVHHLDANGLLQLANLGRRQVVVEDDDVGFEALDALSKLLGLAFADVGGRMDGAQLLLEPVHHHRAGTFGQRGQFRQVVPTIRASQNRAYEDGAFFPDCQRLP